MRTFRLIARVPTGAVFGALAATLALDPPAVTAQGAARADSLAADSARRLDQVRVTVTRAPTSVQRAPWAVDVQDRDAIRRAQATLGIDEALNNVPGVIVSNRYNASVDQRLSIRGAGSRANFGIRGVKVLLDGVPQSLPDGQNQLTNVDLGDISRVEVLRGSASSLYGNGSGGVIAFETDRSAPDRLGASVRLTGGSFGMSKVAGRVSGRTDDATAALAFSRTKVGGFRQFDSSETRQVQGSVDYALSPSRTLQLRASYADLPTSLNPGALTAAEYAANRDSASATNINRYANKTLAQSAFSARLTGGDDRTQYAAVAYVQRRFVDNPLATTPTGAPSGAAGAAIGTLSTLNRWVTGGRVDVSRTVTAGDGTMRLNGGADVERSFDIRRNRRVTHGVPSTPADTVLLDQGESVIAIGPFVSAQYAPAGPLTISAGLRQDWTTFRVTDNFLADGADNSGERTMSAASAHIGASWVFAPAVTVYANAANAFETPTTTELSARPGGLGGFNPDLGPQKIVTIEGGARGEFGDRLRYTAALFQATYTDAIVQYLESNGRAYFRNAGKSRNTGLELGISGRVASWMDAAIAWTESRYRFVDYLAPRTSAITDTLNGRHVAGVPDRFVRATVRTRYRTFTLDVDHTWSGEMYGDDRNTVKVASWGASPFTAPFGVLNARLGWSGTLGGARVAPFAAVNNALNTAFVGAVTVNGAGGRDLEPAPLRNFYVGVETGWPVVR
ncbi:MAG TPA: TonB-dependent receptor [Gemmatimonadaceae bacterium]|nr:TonB-dependent receptor [Gemmatimonadaceae bacterium]